MSDPVHDLPLELEPAPPPRREGARALLRRRDFRRIYLAVLASELGDALHYIAVMWFALEAGGPLGVIAVRLADSVPAVVFGLHGGVAADRFDRKRLMVGADLARAATLAPVAVAGLTGHLSLWALVGAAFLLETATSYFAPAYGALLPSLVERRHVQQANALVQASVQALSIGGWAVAAALVWILPLSAFFAVNAASFVASALLIAGVRSGHGRAAHGEAADVRGGIHALRGRPVLAAATVVLGVAITISSGTWIGGVPTLVRDTLHHGAGAFSIIMAGYAFGSIAAGVLLTHVEVRRKAMASMLAWALYLPAFGAMALATTLWAAVAASACAAVAQSSAVVLVTSAAQEDVPDTLLGRVLGLISLTHRGAHAVGLVLVSTMFAVVDAPAVFAAAAFAIPAVGLAGAAFAVSRGGGARGRVTGRTLRS